MFDDALSCFGVVHEGFAKTLRPSRVSRAGRAGRTHPGGTAMGHGRRGAQKDAAIAGRAERITGGVHADELHGRFQAGVGHDERPGGRWALFLRAGGRRSHLPSGGTGGLNGEKTCKW